MAIPNTLGPPFSWEFSSTAGHLIGFQQRHQVPGPRANGKPGGLHWFLVDFKTCLSEVELKPLGFLLSGRSIMIDSLGKGLQSLESDPMFNPFIVKQWACYLQQTHPEIDEHT